MQIFINEHWILNRFLPPDNYRDKALITSYGFVSVGMMLFIRCLRQMRRGHNSINDNESSPHLPPDFIKTRHSDKVFRSMRKLWRNLFGIAFEFLSTKFRVEPK